MGPLVVLLALSTALAPAERGGGFEIERHLARGVIVARPRGYEPIPVRPDEPWRAARWSESLPENPAERRAVRPELTLLELDSAEAEVGAEPLRAWLAKHAPAWRVLGGRPSLRRGARLGAEHALELDPARAGEEDLLRAGWAFSWAGEGATWTMVGFCAPEDLERESALWRQSARQLRFVEPEEPRLDPAVERLYERGGLTEPELRVAVRAALPEGWRAVDTPHYLIVHDVDDVALVRRVTRDVELLRGEYERLFPPLAREPEAAVVRLCKSRDEYLQYGGDPSSVGHWNPRTRELVLYDVDGPGKNARDSSQTLLVLYHEAFHQYVQHSTGRLPPHSWFDEGHGDYFSGADTSGGRLRRIAPNPWRVERARAAVREGARIPLARLIAMEQADYYADAQTAYALGWSFVYWLRTASEVKRRREWAGILPRYFEGLKRAYAEGLAALAARETITQEEWEEACRAARETALIEAFADVDLDELEAAWVAYVRTLN